MFKRLLKMALPAGKSAFLWGARQTGKSTYLRQHFPQSVCFNLLKSESYLAFTKAPHLLREQILALSSSKLKHPIIIDEVQKVPALLDEIHWLIENTPAQFILCGSSARKLRRGGANLLGGRAWRYHFYPLVYPEIPCFDLLKALNTGLIPSHYLSNNPTKSLQAYVEDYLTEEIKAEGLVRSLPSFSRFLDSLAFTNGEMVNYKNIAQDCGIDAKTVQNYYQILVDTLLGYYLLPYNKKVKRDIISKTPKFYLFDVGVSNYLSKTTIAELKGMAAGHSFEHFIFMELLAYKNINDKRFDICYWRTKTKYEVDFILGEGEIAVEVKINASVKKSELKSLIAFCEEHQPKKAIVVSQDTRPRQLTLENNGVIHILPWREFLDQLWAQKII
jgi:uncharacterized protein